MQALNLPTYSFNIKSEGGRNLILDVIRRKFVALTPEEWVRQNFIRYLCEEKEYPISLMSLETGFSLYKTKKRTDILIFNRAGKPLAMVECKAPAVKIDRSVFDQILRYNLTYELEYILVTNGLTHFCSRIDHKKNTSEFLNEIPMYNNLNGV